MHEASSQLLTTSPSTPASRYQGLLNDYDILLSLLRDTKKSSAVLAKTSVRPAPSSPLELARRLGMSPWNTEDANEHRAAINALAERRASHILQLNNGVSVEDLSSALTDADRTAIRAARRTPEKRGWTTAQLLTDLTQRKIHEAVQQFLPEGETSLLEYLVTTSRLYINTQNVRATPMAYLEKILNTPQSSQLAKALLEKLNWYGAKADEAASPHIRIKLLSHAIRLWEARSKSHSARDIAGYAWHQRSNYGESYQAIWKKFEDHLFESGQAATEMGAIFLARLYQHEFPGDFQIPDVAPELSYRGSAVWVNFAHGVSLAQVLEPQSIAQMSFQHLLEFPIETLANAAEAETQLVAACRIPPTLEWAVAHGILQERIDSDYSDEEQTRALTALDKHNDALKKAIAELGVDVPQRPLIADREYTRIFQNQLFSSGGHKLKRHFEESGGDSTRSAPGQFNDNSYSFRDVYMAGQLSHKTWSITLRDGVTPSTAKIGLDANRRIVSTAGWITEEMKQTALPDVEALFSSEYSAYLSSSKLAYQTLLHSLFCSIPQLDREAIEHGEVRIYTLRGSSGKDKSEDTSTITDALKLRMGFILHLTYKGQTCSYECHARAGLIRKCADISLDMLGGRVDSQVFKSFPTVTKRHMRVGIKVPFDWAAYESGSLPKSNATCEAIIEQLGQTFEPIAPTGYPVPISCGRATELAAFIAKNFFYYHEDKLLEFARAETDLDRRIARPHWLHSVKSFLPFFGSIEDLQSDDSTRRAWGIFGLIVDIVSFAFPIGKFISGIVKLAAVIIRSGFRVALPKFASISRNFLTASLRNMNPLDGVPSLLKMSLRGVYTINKIALRAAGRQLYKALGRSGQYDLIKGLPQISDPGTYRALAASDDLAMTRGIHDIPVRRMGNPDVPEYRMIDPLSNKPYGPALPDKISRLSVGRSTYESQEVADNHVTVELAEHAKVREVLEIDGRTTVFINDVPYRLDGDALRRIELIDDTTRMKRIPCRIKRMPGGAVCINQYVTHTPHADTPALGSFDEAKDYAPWFGERQCTPGARSGLPGEFYVRDGRLYQVLNGAAKQWTGDLVTAGFPTRLLVPKQQLLANMQFRKGIYVRIEIQGAYEGSNELHRVGAIIVPNIDETTTHIFARPNSDTCYLATLPAGETLNAHNTLLMKKLTAAELHESQLGGELQRVYDGSVTANNVAAIYGVPAINRAMTTMERIAIPIGTTANPPANMKWLKVDTSPGEALMFDNSTRMIVTQLPAGSTTWSRSRDASDVLKQRTAEVFDTLFDGPAINQTAGSVYRINNTMQRLNNSLGHLRRPNPRNIAYAEVIKADGAREVYVSVSGGQKVTAKLPLFKNNPGSDRVVKDGTLYINADWGPRPPTTALRVDGSDNLLAIPRTPAQLPVMPTSLDSESKLISAIGRAYPDKQSIQSVNIATTMAPCQSCAVVMKAFGHDGGQDFLNVVWS
ncbi:hypothetical protein [Pseudomonas sp. TWP3-1]|uniref:hypothetical protein n=1 Tax=Pseudomonas sp. TWP3-1 TaxID=2804631 RepID=UPI003CFA1EEA